MNWEAWKPLATLVFTTTLKFAGGFLVAHGLATQGPGLEALGGAATTAAGSVWSWWVQKGHLAAGEWLKHLTDTATQAAAIEVAKRMAPASLTGAAENAKAAAVAAGVAKVLLAAFVLSMFLAGNPASAQTGNIVKDIAAAKAARSGAVTAKTVAAAPAAAAASTSVVSTIDALMQKIDTIASEVVADTVADINAADADAGTIITPATATAPAVVKDAISHACYPAAVTFLQSLPVATPLTGKLFGVQLFQRKRDFLNQLKAGLPDYLKIGCGALLGDEVKIFTSLMGLVGVTVATGGIGGLFPAAAALPTLTL